MVEICVRRSTQGRLTVPCVVGTSLSPMKERMMLKGIATVNFTRKIYKERLTLAWQASPPQYCVSRDVPQTGFTCPSMGLFGGGHPRLHASGVHLTQVLSDRCACVICTSGDKFNSTALDASPIPGHGTWWTVFLDTCTYIQYRPKVWTHLLIQCVSFIFMTIYIVDSHWRHQNYEWTHVELCTKQKSVK